MAAAFSVASFRTRLVLEAPVETPDGAGGVTRAYGPAAMLWARIEPLRGDEEIRAGSLGQAISHRIALRWRAGVDASMRLRQGARVFVIRSAWDPDERRRQIVCLCEEIRP
jgi:SPP1 family predicted phage head-tail adaptor